MFTQFSYARKEGKQHGTGTYVTAGGEKRQGEWTDGRRVRWLDEGNNQ